MWSASLIGEDVFLGEVIKTLLFPTLFCINLYLVYTVAIRVVCHVYNYVVLIILVQYNLISFVWSFMVGYFF